MKIKMTLTSKSIDETIKEIERYKNKLLKQCKQFSELLALEGVEIAQAKIVETDAIESGQLFDSLKTEQGKESNSMFTFLVYTDCPWAKYVEFGTGYKGMNSPHPNTSIVGWKYDINEHGEKGWFYYKNDRWNWTKGMISRPFMFETAIDLQNREIINKCVKQVWG